VKNLMNDKRAIRPGTVYLVGAGPGDPELVTLKARRLLEKADVILYDFLAPHEMLNWARPETEFIYVGKQGGSHTLPQEKINRLMVEAAREGKNVVRLKGGDPFIFGRGGEEAEVLADAGVPFELVPGISSAVSAPLYAGIPLTHRSCTSSVVFLTGHEAADKECTRVPWENVAKAGHTIVILMGVKNIRPNMQCLLDAGMDPNTPVGIIRWGTRPDQRTMTGTVATIADKVERGGFKAPAIIVVGEVVKYRDKLKWHDIKPLFGARVLVTRTKGQAEELSQLLLDAGADVYEVPAIEIVPAIDRPEVDAALDKLGEADWVVLTSANGVRLLMEALLRRGGDIRDLAGKKLAAIGPATAAKIEEMGIRVDLVPPEYKAEGLAASLGEEGVKGKKFLRYPNTRGQRPEDKGTGKGRENRYRRLHKLQHRRQLRGDGRRGGLVGDKDSLHRPRHFKNRPGSRPRCARGGGRIHRTGPGAEDNRNLRRPIPRKVTFNERSCMACIAVIVFPRKSTCPLDLIVPVV